MLGLFKRKDAVTPSVVALLERVFTALDEAEFVEQLRSGVVSRAIVGLNNSIDFFFSHKASRYEKLGLGIVTFRNIRITDTHNTSAWLTISVVDNLVAGIEVSSALCELNAITAIDVSEATTIRAATDAKVQTLLSDAGLPERTAAADLYYFTIDGAEYLRVRELDDGDFLAVRDRNLYVIAHHLPTPIMVPASLFATLQPVVFSASVDQLNHILEHLL